VRRRDPTLSVFHLEAKNDPARRGLTPNKNTTRTNGVRGDATVGVETVRLAGHAQSKWR
jgi:hypothetical protein